MTDTDSSKYSIVAVLLQEQDRPIGMNNDNGESAKEWVTIDYWSKTLIAAEQNHSTTERECLSVVWALKTLRPYIEGTEFTVRSYHDDLRWMMTIADPNGRLTRWSLNLSNFDFKVVYRMVLVNQVPDALSRCTPDDLEDAEVENEIPSFDGTVLATV